MDRDEGTAVLRRLKPEPKAAGVQSVSLLGETARGEAHAADADVTVRPTENLSAGGLEYLYQMDQFEKLTVQVLACKVDLVAEPIRKPALRHSIDKNRAGAF